MVKFDAEVEGHEFWHVYHDFGGDDRPVDIALQCQPGGIWGVVVTGSAQFGYRGYDFLTISYRPESPVFWAEAYPGSHDSLPVMDDFASAVACDNQGRVYVTGRINQDYETKYKFLTVRYNADGTNEVFNVYDGMYDEMYLDGAIDIAVDYQDGGFAYVTGTVEQHVGGPDPHEYLKAIVIKYTKDSLGVDSHAEFGDDAHDVEAVELVPRPMAGAQSKGVCLLVKRAELDSEVVTMTTVMYKLRESNGNLDEEWVRHWYLGEDPEVNGPRGVAVDDDGYVGVVGNVTDARDTEDIAALVYEPNGCVRKDTAFTRGSDGNVELASDIAIYHEAGQDKFIAVVGTTDVDGTDDVLVVHYDWPAPWKWQEADTSMPTGTPATYVKDGAWLAFSPYNGLLYGAKGKQTGDFYSYSEAGGWAARASIPAGPSGKLPYKGAAGCADDDGHLYATKGNGTLEFWKYDIERDSWSQSAYVPMTPEDTKKPKAGTDVAFVRSGSTGYVILHKGGKNNFYRYNTAADSWGAMAKPNSASAKWGSGSWLAADTSGHVYALQGKYHEFWRYDVAQNSWNLVTHGNPYPFHSYKTGKDKKVAAGGCGTWYGGGLWSLKGNNTQELWHLVPGGYWSEQETIPKVGSSGKKKGVKAGGDIAAGDGILYAVKGSGINELWRYRPDTTSSWGTASYEIRRGPGSTDGGEMGIVEGHKCENPRWSSQADVCFTHDDDNGFSQVYVVRYGDPGVELAATEGSSGDNYFASFSPDGQTLAFEHEDTSVSPVHIYTVPVPGSDARRRAAVVPKPAVGADRTRIQGLTARPAPVAAVQRPLLQRPGKRSLVLDNGPMAVETPTQVSTLDWDHSHAEWHPSEPLLVAEIEDSTTYTQLCLIPLGGGDETVITDAAADHCWPKWLSDSELVYIYSEPGEYDRLAKLNLNSMVQTILTDGDYDVEDPPDPAFDGRSAAFIAQDNSGTYQVGLVGADGSNERLLTSSSRDLGEPDWSADGMAIAAVRWFGLTSQIGMVDTASGDFTSLTDSGCIRDKPDVYYVPTTGTNNVVYEREDPNGSDGNKPKPKPRPGTGIFLVRHKKHQDGVMGSGLATDLRRASPNPASGPVTVYWQVAQAGAHATVKAYDAAGRQVNVLFSGKVKAGLNEAVWTCRDSKGRTVPTGVYFCTLETKDDRISRKVILTEAD